MLNVMKRNALRIFSAFIIAATLIGSVSAHPGSTDSSGGHTDHSTGEYHYHHGYEAHDHYDMDGDGDEDCPYDFDDQTDHSNHGYSSEEKDDEWDAVPYDEIKNRVENYGKPLNEEKELSFREKYGVTFIDAIRYLWLSIVISSIPSFFVAYIAGSVAEKILKREPRLVYFALVFALPLIGFTVLVFSRILNS